MKTLIKILAIAVLSIGSINAKTGGGGFSSSSRSSSSSSSSRASSPAPSRPSVAAPSKPSSSWSSSSKPSTPSVAPSKPSTSSWGSSSSSSKSSSSATTQSSPTTKSSGSWLSKPQTSTRPNSSVERQRYESAVKSGKSFTTREAALSDFKAKEATKYTSRYTVEPSTRPAFIPKTYNNQTIVFNQQGGGYGYYTGGGPGLGTFMLYDLASDAIMMDTMMRRSNNYYVGTPPPATVVEYHNGLSGFAWLMIILTTCIIGAILISVIKNL